jgi:hypothetical protein
MESICACHQIATIVYNIYFISKLIIFVEFVL